MELLEKLCKPCGKTKPLTEFYKDKAQKDGRTTTCKECRRSRNATWRLNNPEYAKVAAKEWRSTHPDVSYYVKDKAMAANARWRKKNREKCNAYQSEVRKRFTVYFRHLSAKYRAAKLQAMPLWADISEIAEYYKDAARLTVETGYAWHVDHIVPLQ